MLSYRSEPDIFTCSATISALAGEKWFWASQLLVNTRLIQCIQLNGVSFSAAISACHPQKWEQASDLLRQISLRRLKDETDDISCTAVIGCLGQSSQWQCALDFCRQEFTEFTFGAAIGACAKACQTQGTK